MCWGRPTQGEIETHFPHNRVLALPQGSSPSWDLSARAMKSLPSPIPSKKQQNFIDISPKRRVMSIYGGKCPGSSESPENISKRAESWGGGQELKKPELLLLK